MLQAWVGVGLGWAIGVSCGSTLLRSKLGVFGTLVLVFSCGASFPGGLLHNLCSTWWMVVLPKDVVVDCGAAIPGSRLGEVAIVLFWMAWLVLALAVDVGCVATFPLSKLSCFLFFSSVTFLANFFPVGVDVNFLFSLI